MNKIPTKEDFETLAGYFLMSMEGDTHHIDDAYKLLRYYDLVDEDGFAK